MARWLSGRASDLRSRSRGFEARPRRCCATTYRQVVHTLLPLSPSSIIWHQPKLGSKQACISRGASTRITWSRSVRWCLAVGLACGDQRRLTGNGSALEVVLHDDALYKSTFTLLFTLIRQLIRRRNMSVKSQQGRRERLYWATASCTSTLISAVRKLVLSRPRTRASVLRDVPVYSPSFHQVLIPP